MCEKRKAATEATASSNDSTNVSIFSESAQKLQKKKINFGKSMII